MPNFALEKGQLQSNKIFNAWTPIKQYIGWFDRSSCLESCLNFLWSASLSWISVKFERFWPKNKRSFLWSHLSAFEFGKEFVFFCLLTLVLVKHMVNFCLWVFFSSFNSLILHFTHFFQFQILILFHWTVNAICPVKQPTPVVANFWLFSKSPNFISFVVLLSI